MAHLLARFIRSAILLSFGAFGLLAVTGTAYAQATATPTATTGAAPTPVPCVNAPIGIVIILENPQPGDTLLSGSQVVMNGIAYDTGATTGSGIASVTIYLGDRDAGGLALGTASLGQPNPAAAAGSQFANAGFTLRTPVLPTGNGGRTLFVYAKSILGNAEGVLQVPVYLNSAPTPVRGQVPTPVLPTPPACTPTPTATATVQPTSTPVPVLALATPTPLLRATPTPVSQPAPLAPAPAAPAAAAPAPAAAAPPPAAAAPAPVAVAPAQATAPNGGGMPSEIGIVVLALGAAIVGGGLALRRRERRH